MPAMVGTITIVQESRFMLTDDAGTAHLFLLGRNAAAEPAQLTPLQHRQARVRVDYSTTRTLIGYVADKITLVEPHP